MDNPLKPWQRYPEKTRARAAVHRALRKGTLVRPNACQRCGVKCRPEASHTDYARMLDVEWLCVPCHRKKDMLTACLRGHLFTEQNTYISPSGIRQCKKCKDILNRRIRVRHQPISPRDHKCRQDSFSGLKGAHFDKRSGKYRAQIRRDGKFRSLGSFATAEEAHAAYVRASQ